jgi:hypothetical protein
MYTTLHLCVYSNYYAFYLLSHMHYDFLNQLKLQKHTDVIKYLVENGSNSC